MLRCKFDDFIFFIIISASKKDAIFSQIFFSSVSISNHRRVLLLSGTSLNNENNQVLEEKIIYKSRLHFALCSAAHGFFFVYKSETLDSKSAGSTLISVAFCGQRHARFFLASVSKLKDFMIQYLLIHCLKICSNMNFVNVVLVHRHTFDFKFRFRPYQHNTSFFSCTHKIMH